jgi:5-methyltetrahydropteroyltriglutamate--homocysteine methyltransferase
MRRSTNRILTTHVGSLPGPPDVWGKSAVSDERLAEAVVEVVRQQQDIGIDLVNEGELTKHGSWSSFMKRRLSGLHEATEGEAKSQWMRDLGQSIDRREFAEFYQAAIRHGTLFEQTGTAKMTADDDDLATKVCREPITYSGQRELQREIDTLKAALGATPAGDAFLTTIAPASFEPNVADAYYGSEEKFLFAIAEALAVEYQMIAHAGLMVQVDDAYIPALWESHGVEVGLDAYRKFVELRIEALNHALRNVPREQTRYHLCWGSWHGPHAHDLPLADIIDLVMKVDTGAYLIESANVRHEHEWRVWEATKLPDGKILIPGVVSHATTLIEHPDLISDRIVRFANLLGADNVIASTDCGLGARCHPQIVWAKLKALVAGARQASDRLYS